MYIPKGSLQGDNPRSFSKTELLHILVAMVVLTVAFSFTLSPLYRFNLSRFLAVIPVAFLGIFTAFFVHELSHKFTAQNWALVGIQDVSSRACLILAPRGVYRVCVRSPRRGHVPW